MKHLKVIFPIDTKESTRIDFRCVGMNCATCRIKFICWSSRGVATIDLKDDPLGKVLGKQYVIFRDKLLQQNNLKYSYITTPQHITTFNNVWSKTRVILRDKFFDGIRI